jgi:hypothetical protein
MSSAILQGGATGTGSVTILAPNTNSNQILTLPDATATIVTNKTAGTVLQVVQNTVTTSTSTTSVNTAIDTLLTATITPTSATSKILVLVSQNMQIYIQNSQGQQGLVQIYRGSTFLTTYGEAMFTQFATGNNGYQDSQQQLFVQYLDSPATTSSLTYKTQGYFTNNSANAGIRFQFNGAQSSMTLLEIAA